MTISESSLKSLHHVLCSSYADKDPKGRLISSDKKNILLSEVFQLAKQEIEKLNSNPVKNTEEIKSRLKYLIKLNVDGENHYQRYCLRTKTWTCSFILNIIYYTPLCISRLLQKIYPFNLKNKKDKTQLGYQNYQLTITSKIKQLESILEKINTIQKLKEHLQEKISSQNRKLESVQKKIKKIQGLQSSLQEIIDNKKPEYLKFKNFLIALNELVKNLDNEILISALGPNSKLQDLLVPKADGTSQLANVLEELSVADNLEKFQSIISEFWGKEFADALFSPLKEQMHMDISLQGFINLSIDKVKKQENYLKTYKGMLIIPFTSEKKIKVLNELQDTISKNAGCRPCALTLMLSDDITLNSELIDALLTISQIIPHIKIEGLNHFQLSELSADDQVKFFKLLPYLESANSSRILSLPKSAVEWSDEQFSLISKFMPAVDLDLADFPVSQIERALSFFPYIRKLSIKQPELTDAHFQELFEHNFFKNLVELNLTGCTSLTTDIMADLILMTRLAVLECPDLLKGTKKLPKWSNPFNIKLFYTSAKVTQSIAAKLYQGPWNLAAIFQIPLVRLGEKQVFNSKHKVLDPKSVSLWLHKEDFINLAPQKSIQSIFADNCENINDDNLSPFLQRFPNTAELSLYNCQQITSAGIVNILADCPKLAKLDLTSCHGVTDKIFENIKLFGNLTELTLSDTQITPEQIASLPVELQKKIIWEKKVLKVTEEELKAAKSLDNVLKQHLPLNKLSRIDLEGCTSLTFKDMELLQDRLNEEVEIIEKDGNRSFNPNRLNITALDLTHTNCNESWIVRPHQLLGNLNLVILSNPKVTANLSNKYPSIHFQKEKKLPGLSINPDRHLEQCINYIKAENDAENAPKYAKDYLYNRIALELFQKECTFDPDLQKKVLLKRVDNVASNDFCDMQISFSDGSDKGHSSFNLSKEQIYCQSSFLRNEMREGGLFFKTPPVLENQNATPEAANVIISLIKGKKLEDNLSWKTVAEAAELANPHNLNLPAFYEQLMNNFYEQINKTTAGPLFSNKGKEAFELLSRAARLQDKKALTLYEFKLFNMLLANPHLFAHMYPLAANMQYLLMQCYLLAFLKIALPAGDQNFNSHTMSLFEPVLDSKNIGSIKDLLPIFTPDAQKKIVYKLLDRLKNQLSQEVALYN